MPGTAFGLPELASLNDPQVAVDQAALQRQMEMARMLRQQAMTPVDTSGRMVGQIAYKVSPMEGIAKALQAYQANKMDTGNDQSRLELAQRMAQALKGMYPDNQPTPAAPAAPAPVTDMSSGYPQSVPGQPATSQAAGTPQMGLAGMMRMGIANDIGGPEAAKIAGQQYSTPESVQVLDMTGQSRQQYGAATLGKLLKEANAPTRLGNSAYADPQGMIHGLPTPIAGATNVQDPNAPGGWATVRTPGAAEAIKSAATAEARGKNPGVDVRGQPLPFGEPNGVIPPQKQAGRDDTRVQILKDELARETDPKMRADIQKEISAMQGGGQAYAAPPLGTENAQKGLDTSWEQLKVQNREAQNTKSYLQNVQTAAEKGAITGPGADRREMIQGMLQLAGIKEDVNTNATTQTQLLNKYSNQIVARLGQGGLGTDAARAILTSAYPGQQMNLPAIREAVANLNGAQDMTQAKTKFLLDPATKRDTATYQQREIQFDQAADPRIYQWKAMTNPDQKKAFAKQLIQQDPTVPQRIQALEKMGAW